MKMICLGIFATVSIAGSACAANCSTYSYTLTNGTTADASQVTSNFNTILSCANNNLAPLANPSFTGNVGIGTTTPSQPLEIYSTGSPTIAVSNANQKWGIQVRSDITNSLNIRNLTTSSNVFTISTSNNVGIGNTIPAYPIDVAGEGNFTATSAGARAFGLTVTNSSVTAGTEAGIFFAPTTSPTNSRGAAITASQNGTNQIGLNFYVGYATAAATQAMTITPIGNVGIGTTSPSLNLFVNGTAGGTSAYQIVSDGRLKKNIRPVEGALGVIAKLHPVRYNWRPPSERAVGKSLALSSTDPQVGFIAQEVEKVVPEAVTRAAPRTDSTYKLKEENIIPFLVAAINEQETKIKELESELRRLGGH